MPPRIDTNELILKIATKVCWVVILVSFPNFAFFVFLLWLVSKFNID